MIITKIIFFTKLYSVKLISTIRLITIQKDFYSSELQIYNNKLVFQAKQNYGTILNSDNPVISVISCQITSI